MAIFHMQIKAVARSQGRNAPASAAYRAGELIRNERTGVAYDHRKRLDVLHKEILLPSALQRSDAVPEWLRDRSSLWNAVERTERQRNSRVAREYMVALPAELSAEQRVDLARKFSRDVADRFNVAVDLAVHAPRPYGDPRNFHAHLLTTTREVTQEGLGAKTGLDRQGTVRAELGEPPVRQQFKALRERWAELANEALQSAHLAARVDHRSLAEQGIDREPRPNLPVAAVAALRRGERSVAVERISERYRQRIATQEVSPQPGTSSSSGLSVEQRLRIAMERQAIVPRLPQAQTLTADRVPSQISNAPLGSRDSSERRRQAVRDWLAYRAAQGGQVDSAASERHGPQESESLRRKAVEAWRSLRAKEGKSPNENTAGSERAAQPDTALERRSRDRGPDFSQ